MNKITQLLKNVPKANYVALISLGVLTTYLYFRRKPEVWTKDHKLQLSLEQLIDTPNPQYLKKIVITESQYCSGQTRDVLMQLIKKNLAQNGIAVLVNCSPQKVLRAGCQFFVNYVDQRSKKNIQFYYNAIKAQLLVQRTIVDIDAILRNQQKLPVVMICDNNTLDVKIKANGWRWDDLIQQHHIDQQKLKKNYNVIIHIQNDQQQNQASKKEQKKIADCWKDHQNYMTISQSQFSDQKAKSQAQKALKFIQEYLSPMMGVNYQWKNDINDKVIQQEQRRN